MHRSKGLEFPFVFLAELETEFSKQDSSKKMHVSDTGRMGLYLYDAKNYQKYQTLSYLVLLKEKKQQRQLYGMLDLGRFILPTGCRVFEVYA